MTSTGFIATLATPDGQFLLVADASGAVLGSGWTIDASEVLARIHPSLRPSDIVNHDSGPRPETAKAVAAVDAFYSGEVSAIDEVPVRQHGGPFQLAAWANLRTIPAGHPISYTEFAALAGRPAAARAAAGACAANSPALFVPCHRVLRNDGSLGGFAWGLEVKRGLLEREASQ